MGWVGLCLGQWNHGSRQGGQRDGREQTPPFPQHAPRVSGVFVGGGGPRCGLGICRRAYAFTTACRIERMDWMDARGEVALDGC
jgi:hypothetical protein